MSDRKDEGMPAACTGCMSRRAFLADAAALASVAALLAACADAGVTAPLDPVQIKVGNFPGLATVNQLVLVDGQRAAKRTGDASFAAWSRLCTHEGTPVGISGSGFVCPNHGSRFDAEGNVTLGPASRGLQPLVTSYDAATDVLTIG